MEQDEEVVLLDMIGSTYGMRVKIALAEKGIKYQYKEENFFQKSPLLLKMNPLHKKIPVLIHNGKPICESLIILQYIDEVWNDGKLPNLLPNDPYDRAMARFWADYIDNKIYEGTAKKIWTTKGEEQEKAKKKLIEYLKVMEEELGDKVYFNGESLGFVDVALVPLYCMFYSLEMYGNFSLEVECPKLVGWAKNCMKKDSVSQSLLEPEVIYNMIMQLRIKLGLD